MQKIEEAAFDLRQLRFAWSSLNAHHQFIPHIPQAVIITIKVAYFAYGFAMFAAWPSMKVEFKKYPAVYRSEESMMKVMPFGMVNECIKRPLI